MSRASISVLCIFFLICGFGCRFNIELVASGSSIIMVPDDYSTIQDAVRAAGSGDTIYVSAGIYYGRVIIDKERLRIVGEGYASTVVDLNGTKIEIVADGVFFCGFTIRNARNPNFAVDVTANEAVVCNNLFESNYGGVRVGAFMGATAENNWIIHNAFHENSGYGVFVRSAKTTVISGNTFLRNNWGVTLYHSTENLIISNEMTATDNLCINLNNSTYNVVSNNLLRQGRLGIYVDYNSNHNTLFGNIVSHMEGWGVWVYNSFFNILENNKLSDNFVGLYLERAAHAIMNENVMSSNNYNFGVSGQKLLHFIHDIDSSNTLDGKFVYYFVNQSHIALNSSVIPNAGFLGIVNSTELTIDNLLVDGNWQGVLLAHVSNSTIKNVHVSHSYVGVDFFNSNGNQFSRNTVADNTYGVRLVNSSNLLYKNNIISNVHQAFISGDSSMWDNGAEGNHWSDYTGYDDNLDGVGDIPYPVDEENVDNFPLMELVCSTRVFEAGTWNDTSYYVSVSSNSTVAGFGFSQSLKRFSFNVTGPMGKPGFCNVTIPNDLLGGPYEVWIDGLYVDFLEASNGTHSSLHFAYNHSTWNAKIVGTTVIPEFQLLQFVQAFVFLSLLVALVVFVKRLCSNHRVL